MFVAFAGFCGLLGLPTGVFEVSVLLECVAVSQGNLRPTCPGSRVDSSSGIVQSARNRHNVTMTSKNIVIDSAFTSNSDWYRLEPCFESLTATRLAGFSSLSKNFGNSFTEAV
jgi:hypothetical protein